MTHNANDNTEAWENRALGADGAQAQAVQLSPDEEAAIDDAAGMKAISIRLEKSLIEDFKMIAALHGLGYQPLMRQALKRFADAEKRKLLTEAFNKMQERETKAPLPEDPNGQEAA